MSRLTKSVACWLLCVPAFAAAGQAKDWVEGRLRLRDDGIAAEGVANVLVSNGEQLVRSDADGRYRIALGEGQTLFVIKPAGVAAVFDSDGARRFWRHRGRFDAPALRFGGLRAEPDLAALPDGAWDFTLEPEQGFAQPALEILLFGDPQPKTARQADYFDRDIVEPILRAAALDPTDPRSYLPGAAADLGITLGDIVDDDLDLLPLIKRSTERLGVPWLYAAGNHDLDFDASGDHDSLLSFRALFGPDTFAWEEAQANLIVLDDVIYQPGAKPAYVGGLRDEQFAFLAAYLATLDRSKRLLIAAHIPFFDPDPARGTFRRADRERLFGLLAPFERVLLLSAHGHVQRHHFHTAADGWHGSEPLHEYNVGAACGGYWGGVPDADGIPDALMEDGTPNGYASLRIDASGDYWLRWHVARQPGHPGIELHAPKVMRHGAWPGVGLYANVLMGLPDSVVEWRVDDGDWQPMQRVEAPDPRVLAINLADDAASVLDEIDRVPEAKPSTHLWRAAVPTDLEPGEHRLDVRTVDRWRGELRASTVYRLDPRQLP